MTTEAEASEKWCPFASVDRVHVSANRSEFGNDISLFEASHCLGSRCMAWQWVYKLSEDQSYPDRTENGYCGAFTNQNQQEFIYHKQQGERNLREPQPTSIAPTLL